MGNTVISSVLFTIGSVVNCAEPRLLKNLYMSNPSIMDTLAVLDFTAFGRGEW